MAFSLSLDPDYWWNALLSQESGGSQYWDDGRVKISSAGAVGIAQVMPATAQEVAAKHGIPWDYNSYLRDADYNERLGRLYFEDQIKSFGDPILALAAYNGGPGFVQRAVRTLGDPRSGEISYDDWIDRLPELGKGYEETRNYVRSITARTNNPTYARENRSQNPNTRDNFSHPPVPTSPTVPTPPIVESPFRQSSSSFASGLRGIF